jgi:chromosome partitioning protein
MRRIAVTNQKGGVGKTTTTVNLGAALAHMGYRVLLIDLDPQGHVALHLGLDLDDTTPTTYDVLTRSIPVSQVRRLVKENLWCVGSDTALAAAIPELMGVVGREMVLRDALDADSESYDYILMDCPPALDLLTLNAMAAAWEVLVPLEPHFLALQGFGELLKTVNLVSQRINPRLRVTGVVLCKFESATRLSSEVVDDLDAFLRQAGRVGSPWAGARVFQARIRRNIKLAESPSHGLSIFEYEKGCNGAIDYQQLALEVAGGPADGSVAARLDPGASSMTGPVDAFAGAVASTPPVGSHDAAPASEGPESVDAGVPGTLR